MAENISKITVENLRKFIEKLDENHHAVEDLFNNELKKNLTRSGIMDHNPEECDILIEELNKAIEAVESKVNHKLIYVKDHLKQSKIDVLERKLMHCTCQHVTMRRDSKKARDKEKKEDSGIMSVDSRVLSVPGGVPIVQPSSIHDSKPESGADD